MSSLIPYAAVASPLGDVLVEHSTRSGNAGDIAQRILSKLPARDSASGGRRSYSMSDQGYTYRLAWGAGSGHIFVIMERDIDDAAVWRLLGRVRQRWEQRFGPGSAAVSAAAAAPFSSVLAEIIAWPAADGTPTADEELGSVNKQLDQVRNVMADSIEKVLERGERIELLVERADRLEANAVQFSKGSTSLRRSMRWQARKFYIYMGGAAAVVLLVLAFGFCGGSLSECRGGGDASPAAEGFVQVPMD